MDAQSTENRRITLFRKALKAITWTIAILFIGAFSLYSWSNRDAVKIRGTLATGRLADLPESATNVEVTTVGNMFSRQFFLRFDADSNDIETFIAGSPGLKGITPEYLDSQNQYPKPTKQRDALGFEDSEAYLPGTTHGTRIRWWAPVVRERGRLFEIPWDKNQNYGVVIIDDVSNVVFVKTGHS